MKENNIKNRIFVFGCPRSGTTLLQSILYNLPGSFPLPETYFFQYLAENKFASPRSLPAFSKYKYPEELSKEAIKRVLNFLKRDKFFKFNEKDENDLLSKYKSNKINISDFFDMMALSYASREVKKQENLIIIEKTPIHTFHYRFIKSIFPDAIFLSIVRDPRDVYASFKRMLKAQNKKTRTVSEFCYLWNKSNKLAVKNKINIIKYEDLLDNPLKEINNFLSRHNMKISKLDNNYYEKIVRPGEEAFRSEAKEQIIKNNKNKFLQKLNKKEIYIIEQACAELMIYFGYKRVLTKNYWFYRKLDRLRWKIDKYIFLNKLRLKN